MRRASHGGWIAGLATLLALDTAALEAPPASDQIESVQSRPWPRRGAFVLSPVAAYALDDPFLIRGGGGLRASWWPRSLLAITLDIEGWGQTPSAAARVAQRELRARMRPGGSSWFIAAGAEIPAVDGKVAVGRAIVPFELVVRAAMGVASSTEDLDGDPVAVMVAAAGARWFGGGHWALETAITWRTAPLVREIDGRNVSTRDSVVAFELGLPLRFGGEP